MPAFLSDIRPFYGKGTTNEKGESLEVFLEKYNSKQYATPSCTVDTLVFKHEKDFATVETGLKLLLVKRKDHPCIGHWALPGGFVNMRESLEAAARRELEEETGLTDIAIEQLYTWGETWRDPRTRVITTSYVALIDEDRKVEAGDDAAQALWFDVEFLKLEQESEYDNTKKKSSYEIVLTNKECNIGLMSVVEVMENSKGILKEPEYNVTSSKKIAFDHGRIIVQALLRIQKKIK